MRENSIPLRHASCVESPYEDLNDQGHPQLESDRIHGHGWGGTRAGIAIPGQNRADASKIPVADRAARKRPVFYEIGAFKPF